MRRGTLILLIALFLLLVGTATFQILVSRDARRPGPGSTSSPSPASTP
jgi:hypothetical protein